MSKREEILETVSELVEKEGAKSVTMEDICRSLAISKKTLYKFFANKNDVMQEFVKYSYHQFEDTVTEKTKGINNPKDLLRIIDHALVDNVLTINPQIISDLKKHYKKPHLERLHVREQINACLQSVIKSGQEAGIFMKEVEPSIVCSTRLREIESLWVQIKEKSKSQLKKEQDQIFEVFVRGISSNT